MEDKKIKSCPFCGHDKVSVTTHVAGNGETYVKVTCKKCWQVRVNGELIKKK